MANEYHRNAKPRIAKPRIAKPRIAKPRIAKPQLGKNSHARIAEPLLGNGSATSQAGAWRSQLGNTFTTGNGT